VAFLLAPVNNIMDDADNNPTPKGKRGPKPKQLQEKIVLGLPVGRDKKIVPPDEVFKLAALGLKTTEIAEYFGVTDESISRNFAEILTKARVELKISLRRAMLHNACANNNAAVQIFLSKNLLGFSDTPVNSEANQPLPWTDD
jgi:hypothetical protein